MCLAFLFALLSAVVYKSHTVSTDVRNISFHLVCTEHTMADSFCFACRETANIPLIALGLKETKEVDFSSPFKVQKQQRQTFRIFPVMQAL